MLDKWFPLIYQICIIVIIITTTNYYYYYWLLGVGGDKLSPAGCPKGKHKLGSEAQAQARGVKREAF